MLVLKQSTSVKIRIGPFVDATDAVTPEVSITLGGADQAEVLKADGVATVTMGGTFAAITGADGWYDYTLAVGDVDTVGEVVFVVQDSSVCLPVLVRAMVIEEAVYDNIYLAAATAPATEAKQDIAQTDLDTITDTDGVILGAAGVDLIWDELMAGHTTADTSGLLMNDWQDAGRLDAILDIIAADVVNVDGIVPANAAAVATEIADALDTDTYAEPGQGLPGATITLAQKIGYIYKFMRNRKTSTATLINVYNDDTTTVDHKRTISDNGATYDEEEVVTGP